jgi:hypothetical protein
MESNESSVASLQSQYKMSFYNTFSNNIFSNNIFSNSGLKNEWTRPSKLESVLLFFIGVTLLHVCT